MVTAPALAALRDARAVAVVGGAVYAAVVFAWLSANGVYFATDNPLGVAIGLAYGLGGLFAMAAAPLYLLGRFSLVGPALATPWFLGNTVYQWAYGSHLHPLSSYLTVWPLLFGVAVAVGALEAAVRIAADRAVGSLGLRRLL